MMSIIQKFLEHDFISRFYAFVEPCLPSLNTVNPLLSPQGGLFISSPFGGGGFNRDGGLIREGGGGLNRGFTVYGV